MREELALRLSRSLASLGWSPPEGAGPRWLSLTVAPARPWLSRRLRAHQLGVHWRSCAELGAADGDWVWMIDESRACARAMQLCVVRAPRGAPAQLVWPADELLAESPALVTAGRPLRLCSDPTISARPLERPAAEVALRPVACDAFYRCPPASLDAALRAAVSAGLFVEVASEADHPPADQGADGRSDSAHLGAQVWVRVPDDPRLGPFTPALGGGGDALSEGRSTWCTGGDEPALLAGSASIQLLVSRVLPPPAGSSTRRQLDLPGAAPARLPCLFRHRVCPHATRLSLLAPAHAPNGPGLLAGRAAQPAVTEDVLGVSRGRWSPTRGRAGCRAPCRTREGRCSVLAGRLR